MPYLESETKRKNVILINFNTSTEVKSKSNSSLLSIARIYNIDFTTI